MLMHFMKIEVPYVSLLGYQTDHNNKKNIPKTFTKIFI